MAAAWSLAAFVVFATICPQNLRPHLAGAQLERFGAFFVTASMFVLAYPSRPRMIAAGAVVAAILLELAQLLAPGRDAGVPDAIAKASGGVCGVLATLIALALLRRLTAKPATP